MALSLIIGWRISSDSASSRVAPNECASAEAVGIGFELVPMRQLVRVVPERARHRIGRVGPHLARNVLAVKGTQRLPVPQRQMAQLVRQQQQALALGQVADRFANHEHAAQHRLGLNAALHHPQFERLRCNPRLGQQAIEAHAHPLGAFAVWGGGDALLES